MKEGDERRAWPGGSARRNGSCGYRRLVRVVNDEGIASALLPISPGVPRVVAGGNFGTPWHLVSLADQVLPTYRLFALNAQSGIPDRAGVCLETPFVGPGMRGRAGLDYLPMRLSLVPAFFTVAGAPDVVLVQASPPRSGKVSLGIEVNILPAAVEATRRNGGLVLAQINRHMPHTLGDAEVDVDLIDLGIEHDSPLPSPAAVVADDTTAVIGERVSAFVEDGATLQVGIGAVPDATLAQLGDRRRLGVWSEMVSDGILRLEQAGALDRERQITASFLFGSAELYEWADRNERIRLHRTETTNDPVLIARNAQMLSVNTALQVDLFAQANASWVRGLIYSGFGGQTDFIVGSLHSPGGHAIIALPSWHPKADKTSIVPLLDGPVTSFQHTAIVTEQGCAVLFGRSQHEQAEGIVEQAAHPDAREWLRSEGVRRGILRMVR